MVAMPATVCAMLSDSAFCLSDSSRRLRTVTSVMVPMSRAGSPVRTARDLAARGEPAHAPVQRPAAVLGVEVEAARDGMAQGVNDRLEVLAMHGREPVVAMEGHTVRGNADDVEEQGRRLDLAAREIQIENPESACALREAQEFGGAMQRGLPLLAEAQGSAHAFGERVELVRPGGWRGVRIGDGSERFAQSADAARHLGRRDVAPPAPSRGPAPRP